MSEIGDIFANHRENWKRKKYSTELLQTEGISFTSHNGGIHLVVTGNEGKIDFWPSTGKWITRYQVGDWKHKTGRGVYNLIKEVRRNVV